MTSHMTQTNSTQTDSAKKTLSSPPNSLYTCAADVQAAVKEVADKLGEDGRILVRESGTEPVIRVMVEARTDEEAEKCVDYVVDVINKKGHAL